MTEPNDAEFGRLLTKSISRISKLQSKTIGLIQDELGYGIGRDNGGSAIAHWSKGNIPSKSSDIQMLTRILVVKDGFSDEQEALAFLTAAGYLHADVLAAQLFPSLSLKTQLSEQETTKPFAQTARMASTAYYRRLVGRDQLISRIVALLCDPQSSTIVGIDGIGGIGKTAFASEVAEICIRRRWFEQVIRLDAPRTRRVMLVDSVDTFTFSRVLNTILGQLNFPELNILSEEQKESRLAMYLRNHRILFLLDNLETAAEPQTEILRRLLPLLGISKVIATSRRRFSGDLYLVHLQGLEGSSAQELILEVAKGKDSSHIREASNVQLAQIIETTGGSPLAIKLVVDQLNHLPINSVLKYLREVKPISRDPEQDEYLVLYRHIYFPSWSLLSSSGKKLLVAMSHFVQSEGGTIEAIAHISSLPDIEMSLDELWKLSLLEVKSSVNEPAYFLHTLTTHFVRSDIINSKSLLA